MDNVPTLPPPEVMRNVPLSTPFGVTVPYALMDAAPVWPWKVQVQLSKR